MYVLLRKEKTDDDEYIYKKSEIAGFNEGGAFWLPMVRSGSSGDLFSSGDEMESQREAQQFILIISVVCFRCCFFVDCVCVFGVYFRVISLYHTWA